MIPVDRMMGKGSGTLVDLVYFVDDNNISVQDIFSIIERNNFFIRPKRIGGKYGPVEQDKVTIEDWNPHLSVGIERDQYVM